MGDTCHVFVTNKVNLYLSDTCCVLVIELTNKINPYSGATWLFIVTDFLTNVDYVYLINNMPNWSSTYVYWY
jgi:hypothetical protein